MNKYAIIVAGGKGERMGGETPKQFLELNGQPILMHTIKKFKQTLPEIKIILALPGNQFDYWEELCYKYEFVTTPHQIVKGGETRFHSVQNALALVREKSIVAIHDGVRPLVNTQTIQTCFTEAEKLGNAIPVIDVVDSLRFVSKANKTNKAIPRSCYKSVQTPQCFQSDIILKAYKQDYNSAFTDDASVVEQMGEEIHLVEGNRENIKITSIEDLKIATALLEN